MEGDQADHAMAGENTRTGAAYHIGRRNDHAGMYIATGNRDERNKAIDHHNAATPYGGNDYPAKGKDGH